MAENKDEFATEPKTKGFHGGKVWAAGGTVVAIGIGLAIYALAQSPGGGGDGSTSSETSIDSKNKPVTPTSVKGGDDQIDQLIKSTSVATVPKIEAAEAPTTTGESVPSIGGTNTTIKPQVDTQQNTQQSDLQQQIQQAKNQAILKRVNAKYSAYGSKSMMGGINGKTNASGGTVDIAISPSGVGKNNSSEVYSKTENKAYSSSKLIPAKSPYELKATSIIPCVMISGLNSEKPGDIAAMVSENVYDTRYGRYLLIPMGTKIYGTYSNNVSYGDNRIAVAWQRLSYPNADSFDLQGLPGSDLAGFSGFSDQVDNHYWQLFGTSFVMGVITAGMQYSQNSTNPTTQAGAYNYGNPTIGQTMAGSLGQQLGQTGLQVTQKVLNVAPTIIIRQGMQFNIMIAADLVLKKYVAD